MCQILVQAVCLHKISLHNPQTVHRRWGRIKPCRGHISTEVHFRCTDLCGILSSMARVEQVPNEKPEVKHFKQDVSILSPLNPFLCFSYCLTAQNQFQNPQADTNFAAWHKLFPQARHKSGEFKFFFLGLCAQREQSQSPLTGITLNEPIQALPVQVLPWTETEKEGKSRQLTSQAFAWDLEKAAGIFSVCLSKSINTLWEALQGDSWSWHWVSCNWDK